MKTALADYKTKTKKSFGHLLALEVVKEHEKWVEQACFQDVGGSSSSTKRKSGEYETASNDNIIPDMNEDPNPVFETKKGKKKKPTISSSISSVADDISSYTISKTKWLEEKREKEKLASTLLATQIEGAKLKNIQREMKFFMDPHDHITDPAMLQFVLNQKRDLATKHGWSINF